MGGFFYFFCKPSLRIRTYLLNLILTELRRKYLFSIITKKEGSLIIIGIIGSYSLKEKIWNIDATTLKIISINKIKLRNWYLFSFKILIQISLMILRGRTKNSILF